MWVVIGEVVLLFSLFGGLYKAWEKFFKPYTKKVKLKKLFNMINDWFDKIDCNLESGLNMSEINNLENKITDYIEANLKSLRIRPSHSIIRKWNRKMGLSKEHWDNPEQFRKYSRVPAQGIHLESFFYMLIGKFSEFHSQYSSNEPEGNFADIEMPIKFFRFYLEKKYSVN